MLRRSDILRKDVYKPGEVSKILHVGTRAVYNYTEKGDLKYILSKGNRRLITSESLADYLNTQGLLYDDSHEVKSDILYTRVSTHRQKARGDLDRQSARLKDFVITQNPRNIIEISDVASGLNDQRKGLLKLLQLVQTGQVNRIFVLYKDRLTRFGFNYIKTICDFHNVEIVIVSSEENDKSLSEELAEDIIAIIHSFSGKLYGLRRHVKEAVNKLDD